MEENIEKNKGNKVAHMYSFAFLLILAGGLLLGFNLGLIPAEYKPIFISWQMLLIALGLCEIVKKHFIGGLIILGIGVFFILPVVSSIFPDFMGGNAISIRQYWPILLIFVGLVLIFKKKKEGTGNKEEKCFDNYKCSSKIENTGDKVHENILFNGSEVIVLSSQFEGGEANVLFGEIKIDLRKAKLSEDGANILKAACLFGSVILYIPSEWRLKINRSVMFGNIEDKRLPPETETDLSAPILNIKADCLFGNIEIR